MAERVETIRLTANVANYITGMQQAQAATAKTATAAQKLAAQGAAMTNLGHTLLLFGTAVAAGVVLAVKSFADFDAKMSMVKTLSGATAEDMDQLAHSAETLGQKIGITAAQTADAEIELVKAGVSVKDILGGALVGSLQLAAAGQIDVADATEIATIALTQFRLQGAQIPHVADLLTAGADKALGGVSDLGEALKSGGLVASQFGVSLEETVGTLSAFANAGLIGETAGTDLRQLLLKLANPSKEASDAMKNLGISIYDTSGKFVGINGLSEELYAKLNGLTEAQRNSTLAIIFGSRAIAGANVLYKEGAQAGGGIADWTSKVDDAGFAAKQAAGKMDNLNGDLSKLGAAFQTDLIRTGSTANDILREMVQLLTGVVSAYGNLPGPVQAAVLAVGAIVAVLALASGTFLTLLPKIQATRAAMSELGITMKGTAIGAGVAGGALAALTIVVGIFAQQQAQAASDAADLKETLDATTGAITNQTRAMVIQKLGSQDLYKVAKESGISQKELTDAVIEGGAALDKVNAKFVANNTVGTFFTGVGIRAGNANDAVNRLAGSLTDSQQQFADQAKAADSSSSSTDQAAAAYQSAATQASNLNDQISQLVDTINTANGVGQDAVTTNASYQKAISDLDTYVTNAAKHLNGYTLGVDENTAAGSNNVAMLADLAKKNEDAAKAQFALDGNTDNYIASLKAGHQAVVDHAEALGATADQAAAIADKVASIPSDKEVKILVDTTEAAKTIDDFITQYGQRAGTIIFRSQSLPAGAHGTFAGGGYTGDGGRMQPAGVVHKGEFVSTAATTAKPSNRAALEYMQSGGTIPGFAGGGYVSAPRASWNWGAGASADRTVKVDIDVHGETDPNVFAELTGQSVASRLRGIK